jgi:hypothetical protein
MDSSRSGAWCRGRAARRAGLLALALGLTFGPSSARADDLDPDRWEPGGVPAFNYNSDIGVGLGAVGWLARFEEGYNPYRFRLQLQLFASINRDEAGDYGVPFHDHQLALDFPGLLDGALRLNARLGFGKFSNAGYYGIGAASERRVFSEEQLETDEAARRYHQYGRTFPSVQLNGRVNLYEEPVPVGKRRLELLVGSELSFSWMDVYARSKLAEDVALADQDSPDGRTLNVLLDGTDDHVLWLANLGLLWDTRDHEFAPTRGTFTELSARLSPGVQHQLRYVGLHLGSRWFAPIIPDHLVVASRGVVDALFGHAPLYELSRFGVLDPKDGPGGAASVRGVLLRRYHGKLKVIGNLELRGRFPWVTIGGERFRFGLVAFADAGRVWADGHRRVVAGQNLDGPYAPIRVGLGGGARIQWGETFLLRVDGAHSPTDRTDGFYVDVGHVF